ncbi:luciferin 4-monooxygenase-like [Cydia strobilella]|uniref:luciferin 4-monooxygenase-like n=1 Tax=Cydia strobilella TaxID=1100964 RepID=UPI003006C063
MVKCRLSRVQKKCLFEEKMSYAVERGRPWKSQLYLDGVLDSIIQNGGSRAKSREGVNLAEVIFYCMKNNPDGMHTINGATGEKFTNDQILKRAVSIARALKSDRTTETVIIMLRNSEHMSALFYALLFAGVVPFMMEPNSTEYEIQQFLPLVSPHIIFCEPDRVDIATKAVEETDIRVVVADGSSLDKFTLGCSDDIGSFQLPEVRPDATALIQPTSGSTGVPKAAMLTHEGIIMQMPSVWIHYTQFPRPTSMALLVSTCQWLTHTIIMTGFPVYQVPILMTPLKISAEYIAELAGKYRATWTIIGPALATPLGHLATRDQLSSIDRFCVGGSTFSPDMLAPLQDKLPAPGCLLNGFGMTEAHGLVAVGPPGTPLNSVGHISNILNLINEKGEIVKEPNEKGELYIKGKCLFKGYLNNEAAYRETVSPDGWLKTGDVFYRDEQERLFFVNRTKLSFKYLNHHVYPEEIERVIGSIPGVQQCVVVGADAGPAAAVVLQEGCGVTREDIQQAVKSTLSDYKHLRGGIVIVTSLPTTHTGKVHRASCLQLIQELVGREECF